MGCCCSGLFGFQQLDEADALPVVTFDRSCAGPKVRSAAVCRCHRCQLVSAGVPAAVANVTAVRCQQVIISSFAISGTGSALATTAIDQDRAFFEVKVLKAGGYRAARNAQR